MYLMLLLKHYLFYNHLIYTFTNKITLRKTITNLHFCLPPGRSGSERDISAKAREVTARLTSNTRQRQKPETTGDNNCMSF